MAFCPYWHYSIARNRIFVSWRRTAVVETDASSSSSGSVAIRTPPHCNARIAVTTSATFLAAVLGTTAAAIGYAARTTCHKVRIAVTTSATFLAAVLGTTAEAIVEAATSTSRK